MSIQYTKVSDSSIESADALRVEKAAKILKGQMNEEAIELGSMTDNVEAE